jgi:predicted nucleotidyltransferase
MADSILTDAEQRLVRELEARGVRYLVVGMSAALIQGARGATEDIDLWFEDVADPRIDEAVRAAGGIWISGSFGLGPPRIGGDTLGERFDVVTRVDGLEDFAAEYARVKVETIEGVRLPLLPLDRILASKRAAGRPKDLAAAHSIEDAILVLDQADKQARGEE